MSKKIYLLDFNYFDKSGNVQTLEIKNYDLDNKDNIVKENVRYLLDMGADSIVVKETCIYKVL